MQGHRPEIPQAEIASRNYLRQQLLRFDPLTPKKPAWKTSLSRASKEIPVDDIKATKNLLNNKKELPHFLMIVLDEMGAFRPHELNNPEFVRWLHASLPNIMQLLNTGANFKQMHIRSSACTPARAALFSGLPPEVTGVTDTSRPLFGWDDERMTPFNPAFGTLADYLKACGYIKINYEGKWHISDAELKNPDGSVIACFDEKGKPIEKNIKKYHEAQLLKPFGFSDHSGEEPHGIGYHNLGAIRDEQFVDAAIERMNRVKKSRHPLALCVSLVNPHDICLWPKIFYENRDLLNILKKMPKIPSDPTRNQPREQLPQIMQSYYEAFRDIFASSRNGYDFNEVYGDEQLQKSFYYFLLMLADAHVGRLMKGLQDNGLLQNTLVVLTSDHGDLLGALGLQQKWLSADNNVTRVPCTFVHPDIPAISHENLVSHADILPTILGLLGKSELQLRPLVNKMLLEREIKPNVQPRHGRDRSQQILQPRIIAPSDSVAFTTEDNVFEGLGPMNLRAQLFFENLEKMGAPNFYQPAKNRRPKVEAVLFNDPRDKNYLFKLVRFSNTLKTDTFEYQFFRMHHDPAKQTGEEEMAKNDLRLKEPEMFQEALRRLDTELVRSTSRYLSAKL